MNEKQEEIRDPWTSLTHNGVYFPPPYEPHKIAILHNGTVFPLHPVEEEMITLYLAHLCRHDHDDDEEFHNNFFACWTKELSKRTGDDRCEIRSLKECNFADIVHHVRHNQQSQRIIRDDGERYRFCYVDGVRFPVLGCNDTISYGICCGDYDVPSGTYRHRLMPEDITVNCGVGDVPPTPPAGHHWGEVTHDHHSWWVSTWYDEVSEKHKYIRVGESIRCINDDDEYTGRTPLNLLLSRTLSVLAVVQEEYPHTEIYVCPNDVSWSVIDLYTYFNIHNATLSHKIQHTNITWPLGMATLFDRYLLIADFKKYCIHLCDMQDENECGKYVGHISVQRPNFIATHGHYVVVTAENHGSHECIVYRVDDDVTMFQHIHTFTHYREMDGVLFLNDDNVLVCSHDAVVVFTISSGLSTPHGIKVPRSTTFLDFCGVCLHPVHRDMLLISCFSSNNVFIISRTTFTCVDVIDVPALMQIPKVKTGYKLGLNGIVCVPDTATVVVMCAVTNQLLVLEEWSEEAPYSPKVGKFVPVTNFTRLHFFDRRLLCSVSNPPSIFVYR